jgi:type II restriction enzyme
MNIVLDKRVIEPYKSSSQKIRVLSEDWVNKEAFCPACGYSINQYESNRPVADFFCFHCKEEYELKSKKDSISSKIVNGAYRTMIERLRSNNNPNLFLLNYSLETFEVLNLYFITEYSYCWKNIFCGE